VKYLILLAMIVGYFSAGLGVYYIGRKTKFITGGVDSGDFEAVLFWPFVLFAMLMSGVVKVFEKIFKIIDEDTK
jgi:Na+/alanine symporter